MAEAPANQGDTSKNRWDVVSNRIKKPKLVTLSLEVTSGLSNGCSMSITSGDREAISFIIGRVSTNNLVLQDSDVTATHAVVKFNYETHKWEITDLGSLNGTMLNFATIHHPDVGSRNHGTATVLSDQDIITFGDSTNVLVRITEISLENSPCRRDGAKHLKEIFPNIILSPGIGMASHPLAKRQGGKPLPMEDFGLGQYPLHGVEKFGLVAVFDGFGGSEAAETASKIFPQNVVKVLSQSGEKEKVLSGSDASGILRQAFTLTEDQMKHENEGCTATALLIWSGSDGNLYAQCANLGDSECVIYIDGNEVVMTEKHNLDSHEERIRMAQTGNPLKNSQRRLVGLNVVRMLGSKFVKGKDQRFISEPHVSKALCIPKESTAFAIVASDGLWDPVPPHKAVKFVLENNEKMKGKENYAELMADALLLEAVANRTSDNTTVVFVDFDNLKATG